MAKENIKYKLPDNWIWTTIGELGLITSGGTPSTKEPQFWGGDIPWITPADLSDYKGKYIDKGQRNITKIGLEYSSCVLLPKGSLLFSSRAPIGYTAIAQVDLATNQGFKNIIPVKSIHIDYVYYYLQASNQMILNMASGTTFLELSLSNFKKVPIPIPPLNEQFLIVEKLEELFSELEQSRVGLIQAQDQLKVYRHSFLKNTLDIGFKSTGSKFGNEKVLLGDVVDRYSKKVDPREEPSLKFIGLDSLEPGSLKPQHIYNFKEFSSSGNHFLKNHILYARMRPYLNKVFRAEFEGAASGEFIILECKDSVLVDYLKYVLHSANFVNYATEKSTGDRPRVSFEDISLFEFILPDIETQQQIINEIDYRFTIIENLEDTIQSNLHGLEVYKQSIYKKAFQGKLVPQDLENDSAEKLLVKIREEVFDLLKEYQKNTQKTPKMKQHKKTLIEIIRENYPDTEFTFSELKERLNISYEDVKEQLFILLDSQQEITSSFDKKKAKIFYKLKS